MRLVLFTAFATPHKGGVERYSLAVARRLAALGHSVSIVTCNTEGAPPAENIDGVELIRLPALKLAGGQYPIPLPGPRAFALLRRLRAERPDVIATNTRFYPTSLLGFLAGRLAGCPLYHVEHGSQTFTGPSGVVNAFARLVDRTWGRMILRRADRLFAASEGVRDFVRQLGVRDAEVVSPRVDTSVFRPDVDLRSEWRRRLGIEQDDVVCVFCGRLVRTKGVLDLAEAFGRLTPGRATLLYVGDGPDRARIVETAHVRCLGSLDDDGVVGVLNAADVFVNPSHNEGLPSSVLEAGAVGLAVVATDVGGTREILMSPDVGMLVPPGDVPRLHTALEAMIADPGARSRFGAAIRDVVLRRYAWTDDAVAPFVR